MNGEDLKSLGARAETVRGRADHRLAEVHARITSTRRRRAVQAAAGASAAIVALVICIALLTGTAGPNKRNTPPPPAHSGTPTSSTTREIIYSDDLAFGPGSEVLIRIGTLHVGDREVEIDQTLHSVRFWSMFVTDAGAVYAQEDHSVWFTDGGHPRQIAPQACAYSSADFERLGIATGNAGPLVAWFNYLPASLGDLVVYDTSLGREVARHPIPSCETAYVDACLTPSSVSTCTSPTSTARAGHRSPVQVRRDERPSSPGSSQMYADDLRAYPRALVIGDTWQSGTRTESRSALDAARFRAVGSRLVPLTPEDVPTRAFANATGRPLRFRLPSGYHPDPAAGVYVPGDADASIGTDIFTGLEWLDDDRRYLSRRQQHRWRHHHLPPVRRELRPRRQGCST